MNTIDCPPNLNKLFEEVDNFEYSTSVSKAPIIGISCNKKEDLSCVTYYYFEAVRAAGGTPILIPVTTDFTVLTKTVESLDGLILSGGADINPLFADEEPIRELQDVNTVRDTFDLALLRLASNRQVPIMGICRGHQVLNIAFGGTIYQDIYSQYEGNAIKHSQLQPREQASHMVTISDNDNILASIFGKGNKVAVNSFHHQAVKDIAPEFVQTAVASDGINEGIEHPEKAIFGIQWHPEAMVTGGNKQMTELFRKHIEAAQRFAAAKDFHKKHITIDSHTDTPMIFPGHFDLGKKEGGKVNLPLMNEGMLDAVIMVAYIPQKERNDEGYQKAFALTIDRLDEIHRQEELHPDKMGIAYNPEDIKRLKNEGKKAILCGVENGYAIGKDISKLDILKKAGIVYMTLCHNGNNDICDSARGEREWDGVSPFGAKVISRMNDLGIMVDVSHTSEKTTLDAIKLSRTPIIASHSSAKALCNHPRNLSDETMKEIAKHDGVVQVCLYKGFINKDDEKASLSDAIRHINHMVEVMGIDHVGIGSDFDGDGELIGCRAANELINITTALIKEGYSEEDIAKIWGGNILRVMSKVQEAAL